MNLIISLSCLRKDDPNHEAEAVSPKKSPAIDYLGIWRREALFAQTSTGSRIYVAQISLQISNEGIAKPGLLINKN